MRGEENVRHLHDHQQLRLQAEIRTPSYYSRLQCGLDYDYTLLLVSITCK